MNAMRAELERRKREKSPELAEKTAKEPKTGPEPARDGVREQHLAAARGFMKWLDRLPFEKGRNERGEAHRLARQFEVAAERGQSEAWLVHESGDPPKTKGERLRLALVKSGYEELRLEDDPLSGSELESAARRVFDGAMKEIK